MTLEIVRKFEIETSEEGDSAKFFYQYSMEIDPDYIILQREKLGLDGNVHQELNSQEKGSIATYLWKAQSISIEEINKLGGNVVIISSE